jgi:hypothetical protein
MDAPLAIMVSFRESINRVHKQHALYWALSSTISLAEVMQHEHMDAEAKAIFAPLSNRLTEGFFTLKVKRAEATLR